MATTNPTVLAQLEKDLQSGEVTIQFLDGAQLRKIGRSVLGDSGLRWVRLESGPSLVVGEECPNDDRVWQSKIVATILLEDLVMMETETYGDHYDTAVENPMPVATWLRDKTGELRRFETPK